MQGELIWCLRQVMMVFIIAGSVLISTSDSTFISDKYAHAADEVSAFTLITIYASIYGRLFAVKLASLQVPGVAKVPMRGRSPRQNTYL